MERLDGISVMVGEPRITGVKRGIRKQLLRDGHERGDGGPNETLRRTVNKQVALLEFIKTDKVAQGGLTIRELMFFDVLRANAHVRSNTEGLEPP
jgi:hypothetical protein